MTDQDDAWRTISELRASLVNARERITELEHLTSVYGETLDALRNRVYNLEVAALSTETAASLPKRKD